MKKVTMPQGNGKLVKNVLQEQKNVKVEHDENENAQLVFSFNQFHLQPIRIDREFNNFYKDEDQYVEKISILLGKALPLLSQERESIFTSEKEKRDALHLHKISNKREIVEDILKQYNFSADQIDNIFEGAEGYQLEVPYANGSTRAVFEKIDNKLSFLFMDPNHHVYFNDHIEEAKRALFYEYCPVNKAQQCVRMDYLHTCFAFDFLDEKKYHATWENDFDPMKDVEE